MTEVAGWFLAGMFVGVIVGVLVVGILTAGKRMDEFKDIVFLQEKEQEEEQHDRAD